MRTSRFTLAKRAVLLAGLGTVAVNCVPQDSLLSGTWTGTLTAEIITVSSDTGPPDLDGADVVPVILENDVRISFDGDGVPDKWFVYDTNAASLGRLREMTAVFPGESQQWYDAPAMSGFAVREADYGLLQARAVLDMTYFYDYLRVTLETSWNRSATGTGEQTIQVTWDPNGPRLVWNQQLEGRTEQTLTHYPRSSEEPTVERTWTAHRLKATGTLTRATPE
jgi:hypothetical protein